MKTFINYKELTNHQLMKIKTRLQNLEWIGFEKKKYKFPDFSKFAIFESVEIWKYEDGEVWYNINLKAECINTKQTDWHILTIRENDFEQFINSHCKFHIDEQLNIVLDSIGQTVLEDI